MNGGDSMSTCAYRWSGGRFIEMATTGARGEDALFFQIGGDEFLRDGQHSNRLRTQFGTGPLADIIYVPDALGSRLLSRRWARRSRCASACCPHLALEAAADRVIACGGVTRPDTIALLLDPTEPADGSAMIGEARSTLRHRWRAGVAGSRLLGETHPRQDEGASRP